MKGESAILTLLLVGGGAWLVYLIATNQIGPIVAAGSTGQVPLTNSTAATNCPGGPGC